MMIVFPSPRDYAHQVALPHLNLPFGLEHLTLVKRAELASSMMQVLTGRLPEHIKSAVPHRQYEYGLGRLAASELLGRLGVDSHNLWVGTQMRRPVWPKGIVGSISHTSTFLTICAGHRSCDLESVGVDIEDLQQSQEASDALNLCFLADEVRVVESVVHGRLIGFAAKEALFKCLNPLTAIFFDFAAARLLSIDDRNGNWILELRSALSQSLPALTKLVGSYQFFENHVFASVSWPQPLAGLNDKHARSHSPASWTRPHPSVPQVDGITAKTFLTRASGELLDQGGGSS